MIWSKDVDPKKAALKLTNKIKKLSEWLKEKELYISFEKTQIVKFSRKRTKNEFTKVKINDKEIEYKQEAKYLGLILDEKLNWRKHIEQIKNKVLKRLRVFKMLCKKQNKTKNSPDFIM